MDIPVTEGIYSKDNYEPGLCLLPDNTVWTAWTAYGRHGSRSFVRAFKARRPGPVEPISPNENLQTRPICIPVEGGVRFAWFEKVGRTYSIWTRAHTRGAFTRCEQLHTLPESAKPWALQALCTRDGALWAAWAQSARGKSSIECLRADPGRPPFSLSAGSPFNYRPALVERSGAGVYLAWDGYVDRTYHIYGCAVDPSGPSQPVRISSDPEWENRPGKFAMFPGYEMTITDRVDTGRDHRSVMSDDDEMEMDLLHFKYEDAYRRGERDTHKDPEECIAWFKRKGYLPLPHPHHGKWNLYDTDVEWGVDVCAAWMVNIERFDIYFKYLDAGHKFAFTGSGDSHHRNPGLSGALTGIWAERLDRASLLDAVRSRRCYATAGQKILVEFTINDCMMGSSLTVRDDPTLKWRVIGQPEQPYILRIHRDGRLMHEGSFTGSAEGECQEYMLRRYRPGRRYYLPGSSRSGPRTPVPRQRRPRPGRQGLEHPIWVETEP